MSRITYSICLPRAKRYFSPHCHSSARCRLGLTRPTQPGNHPGAPVLLIALGPLGSLYAAYRNPLTEMAYVVYDPALMDSKHLRAGLDRLGYGISSATPQQLKREEQCHILIQSAQPPDRWPRWAIALASLFVLVGVALRIWGTNNRAYTNMTPATTAPAGAMQTNEGGQVTIAATWQGSGVQPSFNVAMNTHAVDLDGYDLKQLAVLRIDGGREIQPISWEAPKGGYHHKW